MMKKTGLVIALLTISSTAWAGTEYATEQATEITATTAKLNGKAASTVGLGGEIFQYGKTINYGMTAVAAPQGVNGPVSTVIFDLECATTYHFRFIGEAQPPRTTIQGADMTFTTLACEPPVQMMCSVVVSNSWRDTFAVPGTWDQSNCFEYMNAVGAHAYQLACLGPKHVVFGSTGKAGVDPGLPDPNCGWSEQ